MRDEPHISDPVPVVAAQLSSGALVVVPRTWAKGSTLPVIGQYRWASLGNSRSLLSEEDLDKYHPGWRELA